jgi:hypothetical protein
MTFPEILDLNRFCDVMENGEGEGEEVSEMGAEGVGATGVNKHPAAAAAPTTTTTITDSGDEGRCSTHIFIFVVIQL